MFRTFQSVKNYYHRGYEKEKENFHLFENRRKILTSDQTERMNKDFEESLKLGEELFNFSFSESFDS
jgi:hypothetical protein